MPPRGDASHYDDGSTTGMHDAATAAATTSISMYIEVPKVELNVMPPAGLQHDEEALKNWIWQHHGATIQQHMLVKTTDEPTALEICQQRLSLLDKVAQVQLSHLQSEEPKVVFGQVLECLLELMGSEYGFIGECIDDEETGEFNYLQLHASTNISWDEKTRAFYEYYQKIGGLRFYNVDNLFGLVITSGEPVISNDTRRDPRSRGAPKGHPDCQQFLGIPIYGVNRKVIGMIGLANKQGGYSQSDVEFLDPFTVTCSNMMQAFWQIQENRSLIGTLEEKVKERTQALEKTNERLELANRRVKQASAAQLHHFACMSHEIRTPLNCIIGMSSMLQESDLTPMQHESVRMVVNSGDLLLTVVNDVLDYSKLESGNVDIHVDRCSLQDVLTSVVHSIEMKSASKNIRIEGFYDAAVPEMIRTDSRRLQQVLYNLLGNAVKFSKDGGKVELAVSLEDAEDCSKDNDSGYAPVPQLGLENDDDTVPLDMPEPRSILADAAAKGMTSPGKRRQFNQSHGRLSQGLPDGSFHLLEQVSGKNSRNSPPSARTVVTAVESVSEMSVDESASMEALTAAAKSRCPFHRSKRQIHLDQAPSFESFSVVNLPPFKSELEGSDVTGCPMKGRRIRSMSPLSMASTPSKKLLRFRVTDYGKGIEKSDFERIFQPFRQANSETERVYGGTGLGLAITAKLVHRLGGTISVDSKEGEWAEFTVSIPCEAPPVNVQQTSTQLRDSVVAVVSTNQSGIRHAESMLKLYDVDYRICNNLKEAETARSQDPFAPKCRHIFLLDEDLFDVDTWARIVQRSLRHPVLISFGPNFGVPDTQNHFRSIHSVLPSVIMQYMASAPTQNAEALATCPQSRKLDAGKSAAVKRTSSSGTVVYKDLKLLIAEDNRINQKVLVRMLNKIGINEVDVVENGKDAVVKEAANCYDAVLMDLQMPVMDGIDACRLIKRREHGAHAPAPIIFVTAHVLESFEQECAAAGGEAFMSKPYKRQDIEACLEAVVCGQRQSAHLPRVSSSADLSGGDTSSKDSVAVSVSGAETMSVMG